MATAARMAITSMVASACARSTIADEEDHQRSVTIVGNDEADASESRIGWDTPLARALRGATVGDLRRVELPGGSKEWEIVAISYPE